MSSVVVFDTYNSKMGKLNFFLFSKKYFGLKIGFLHKGASFGLGHLEKPWLKIFSFLVVQGAIFILRKDIGVGLAISEDAK